MERTLGNFRKLDRDNNRRCIPLDWLSTAQNINNKIDIVVCHILDRNGSPIMCDGKPAEVHVVTEPDGDGGYVLPDDREYVRVW